MMQERGKSSPVIVAGKPANKAQPETVTAAESVERRAGAKGNADQPATNRTQGRERVAAPGLALALASIRQATMLDCQYPRWEPYAGKLQVRVCAGGARQLASLPRLKRREVITLLGGVAAAWPLAARAQQPGKLRTIGFSGQSTRSAESELVAAFTQRLRELGWIEGRTVTIEYRWAEGRTERFVPIATEFVRLKVDVIVTRGTPQVLATKQATSVIPIVFATVGDPVANGLVASLARPGGNITGLSSQSDDLAGKRLEVLREVVPSLHRVAILANVGNPLGRLAVISAEKKLM